MEEIGLIEILPFYLVLKFLPVSNSKITWSDSFKLFTEFVPFQEA